MKLTVVITMAGLGSRFRKAGYNVPKYMIAPKARPKNIYQRISPSLNFSDNANINSAEIIQNIKSSTQVATVDVLTTLRDILNTSNNNATTTPAIQQRTKIPT